MGSLRVPTLFALAATVLPAYANAAGSEGFIEGSSATLSMRTLYFNSDYRDGSQMPSKTEETAQGFLLRYQSGFTPGPVGFGLDAQGLLGVTLDSGRGRHQGGSMIPSDGDRAVQSWSSIGPTAKMRFAKSEIRYGTLMPKLPVILYNDGRVLPQTFEGVQFTSKDLDDLTFTGGLITKARGRYSTDRTGLSVSGSNQETNRLYFAGFDYNLTERLQAQYYFARLEDFYDQNFLGLNHTYPVSKNSSFVTDLRYFNSSSSGANSTHDGRAKGYRISGYTKDNSGEIDNDTWVAMVTYNIGGHAFTLGHQSVSDGSAFAVQNQGGLVDKGAGGSLTYLPTDRMITGFSRAGEQTDFAQYVYNFAAIGIPGLKTTLAYLKGTGIKVQNGSDQSEWERDLTIDYVIQSGSLKGLGITLRNATLNTEAGRDIDQNRVILNYSLPLF